MDTEGAGTARVAQVGNAFGYLDFDGNLYHEDNLHPTLMGSYLAGLVIYRTKYRRVNQSERQLDGL